MLKVDLHIHTLHSGHAYGSFYDVINEAKRKKMKIIAITDHGPKMTGSAGPLHFGMGYRTPQYKDLKVLWGCEANVLDSEGNIDLDDYLQKKLDVILVSLHGSSGYKDLGLKGNTEAVVKALKKNRIHILTHPAHPMYPYDFDKVFQTALDNDVLLELNLSYLAKYGERDFALFKKLVDMTKKAGKMIVVDSDAHFIHEIGDDAILKKYWTRLGLTKELIINNYPDKLMKFLKKK